MPYMPMQIMWWIELFCQLTTSKSNDDNNYDDKDRVWVLPKYQALALTEN